MAYRSNDLLVGTSPQVQRTLRQICRPRDKSRHNVFVCNFPVWPRTRLIEFPDQRSPSSCQLPLPALQIVAGSRRVQSDAVHSILDDTFSDRRFRDAVIDDDAIAGIDVDRSARGHSERRDDIEVRSSGCYVVPELSRVAQFSGSCGTGIVFRGRCRTKSTHSP